MRAEPQTTRGRGHPGRVTWAVGVRGSIGSRAPRRRLVDARRSSSVGDGSVGWVRNGRCRSSPGPGRPCRPTPIGLREGGASCGRAGGAPCPASPGRWSSCAYHSPRRCCRAPGSSVTDRAGDARTPVLWHWSACGMGVAGLCRPGSATPRSSGVAGLRRRRGRRARRRDGVRPLLAGQDPGAHGCPARRPGVVGGHAPGRSRGVDRVGGAVAWAAAGLPVVGPIARAVDWATRRAGGRLGGGGGGNGPAGERGAAGRSGRRGR